MEEIASFHAVLAEASLVVRAVLLLFVAHRAVEDTRDLVGFGMLVETVVTFLALAVLLKEAANRNPILTKHMHELALVALLTGILHPMDTHALLALFLVDFVVKSVEASLNVVEAHDRTTVAREAIISHAALVMATIAHTI